MKNKDYFSKWANNPRPSHIWHRCDRQVNHPVRALAACILEEWMEASSVLDVACGTCTEADSLSSGLFYVGLDVTRRFIACAKDYYGVPGVINASAHMLPFRDGAFDACTCKDVLEHLPPRMWMGVVREMYRVSRKGLVLVFFGLSDVHDTKDIVGDLGFFYSTIAWKDVCALLEGMGAGYFDVIWNVGMPVNQVVTIVK